MEAGVFASKQRCALNTCAKSCIATFVQSTTLAGSTAFSHSSNTLIADLAIVVSAVFAVAVSSRQALRSSILAVSL